MSAFNKALNFRDRFSKKAQIHETTSSENHMFFLKIT
jgi:hypothetical protein